jgi:hypothetical protein
MHTPKPKSDVPFWQPTRLESAKWHIKNAASAALMLSIVALAALLYLVAVTLVFHHLHWLGHRR